MKRMMLCVVSQGQRLNIEVPADFSGTKTEHRSAGRIDFVVYPQLQLRNSWLDKIYGASVNIAPAVEMQLWKGACFTGQVIFPIWNNMVGEMDYIRAGILTLRQEIRWSIDPSSGNPFAETMDGFFDCR